MEIIAHLQLRLCIALVGGFLKPSSGDSMILRHSSADLVENPEIVLRLNETLLGSALP